MGNNTQSLILQGVIEDPSDTQGSGSDHKTGQLSLWDQHQNEIKYYELFRTFGMDLLTLTSNCFVFQLINLILFSILI